MTQKQIEEGLYNAVSSGNTERFNELINLLEPSEENNIIIDVFTDMLKNYR